MNLTEEARGKVAAQIIEASRNNLDLLDKVKFGTITFFVKGNNVYRLEVNVSKLLLTNDGEENGKGKCLL